MRTAEEIREWVVTQEKRLTNCCEVATTMKMQEEYIRGAAWMAATRVFIDSPKPCTHPRIYTEHGRFLILYTRVEVTFCPDCGEKLKE